MWTAHRGATVVAHAPAGSGAAPAAARELQDAERVVAALAELCRPTPERLGPPVDLYLVDALPPFPGPPGAAAPASGVGASGVLRMVGPDGVNEPLAVSLARFLLPRWFGPAVAGLPAVVDGLGGLAAARSGTGPDVTAADRWVAEHWLGGPGGTAGELALVAPGAGPPPLPAAVSFAARLVETTGNEAVGRFLATYDPDRRDEAAVAAFGRTLPALAEEWLRNLRRVAGRARTATSLRFFISLLAPHRWAYAEVLVFQLVSAVLALALPVVSGCLVGSLQARGTPGGGAPPEDPFCRVVAPELTTTRLAVVVAVLVVVYLAENGLAVRRSYLESRLFQRVAADLRARTFARLHRLSHGFWARARTGDVISCLSADTGMVQASMTQLFSTGSLMAFSATAAVATAVLKNPWVGALVVLATPTLVLAQRAFERRLQDSAIRMQQLHGDVAAFAAESILAQDVVKAYGLEERRLAGYRRRLDDLARAGVSAAVWRQLLESGLNLAVTLGSLGVLGVGSWLVITGRAGDAGTVTTLLLLVSPIMVRASVLLGARQGAQSAAGAVARLAEIDSEPVEIEDAPGAVALPPLAREIRFDAVSFAYDPGRPVLDGFDLAIPAGCHTAVVGPSGSGKSTVVNLIVRFWDPTAGRVLFDGVDLRDGTVASVRAQIGLVLQDSFVFDTTVRDNIALGRAGATDAEVEAAAGAARLDDLVASLPHGFDSVLGERGVRMSGGQRQRLALARALVRDPSILLLDEPTSALDARTEAEIIATLGEVAKGRTVITITHRLAVAAGADLVVLLEGGRVTEQGSHRELIAAGGLYARMWEEQSGAPAGERSRVVPPVLDGAGPPGGDVAAVEVEHGPRGGPERLAAVPLFAALGPVALARLSGRLVRERAAAGTEVVREGDPGERLYLIESGEAEVLVDDGSGPRMVSRLRAGSYFGEYAVLTGAPRSATVRAATPLYLLTLDRSDLEALAAAEPAVAAGLARFVAAQRAAYVAAEAAAGITRHLA